MAPELSTYKIPVLLSRSSSGVNPLEYSLTKQKSLAPPPTPHFTMFFSLLTVFATLAFSAFTSAIPLANEQAGVIAAKDVVAPANGIVTGDVLPRSGLDSIMSILTDMHSQLVPVTAPLSKS